MGTIEATEKKRKPFLYSAISIVICIIVLAILNLVLCPSKSKWTAFKEIAKEVNFPIDKKITVIAPKRFYDVLDEIEKKKFESFLLGKYKEMELLEEHEIISWLRTNKNDYGNKIILVAFFESGFLTFRVASGYKSGSKSGYHLEKSYFWLFGWRVYKEKIRSS